MKPVPVQCQAVTVGANGVEHICALTTTHRYRLKSSNPNCNYQIHLCQWHGNDWKKEGWLCMDKNSPSPEEVKAKMDLNERNQVSEAILFLHSTADGKLFNEESQDKLRLAARILGRYLADVEEKNRSTEKVTAVKEESKPVKTGAYVAKLRPCLTPMFSQTPHAHRSVEEANKEAERLSSLEIGKKFGVFVCIGYVEQPLAPKTWTRTTTE